MKCCVNKITGKRVRWCKIDWFEDSFFMVTLKCKPRNIIFVSVDVDFNFKNITKI